MITTESPLPPDEFEFWKSAVIAALQGGFPFLKTADELLDEYRKRKPVSAEMLIVREGGKVDTGYFNPNVENEEGLILVRRGWKWDSQTNRWSRPEIGITNEYLYKALRYQMMRDMAFADVANL